MLFIKSQNLLYPISLVVFFNIIFSCSKKPGPEIITLNKSTFNSYYHSFYNEELELEEGETMIYSNQKLRKVSILAADIELEHSRFRLSLVDVNQDGNYASPGVDEIVLSPFGQDTVAIDLQRPCVGKLKEKTFIQVDREWFLLSYLDSTGRELKLIPLRSCPKEKRTAVLSTYWKPIAAKNPKGEAVYLKRQNEKNKKQLIIVARKPPLDDFLFQKLYDSKNKWEQQYELSILYMGGFNLGLINTHSKGISFKFPSYFTSSENCKNINCHASPPYGFVLDKGGFILKEGVKEFEIYQLLGI